MLAQETGRWILIKAAPGTVQPLGASQQARWGKEDPACDDPADGLQQVGHHSAFEDKSTGAGLESGIRARILEGGTLRVGDAIAYQV